MKLITSLQTQSYFRSLIESWDAEEFWAVSLDSGLGVLQSKLLFRGTVDHCLVHPRDVFRFALLSNASFLVVAHSHPHGVITPSREDLKVTVQLKKISSLLKIPLLDHLVVNKTEYFSFAEKVWLQ